jgi:hypothetical protein
VLIAPVDEARDGACGSERHRCYRDPGCGYDSNSEYSLILQSLHHGFSINPQKSAKLKCHMLTEAAATLAHFDC